MAPPIPSTPAFVHAFIHSFIKLLLPPLSEKLPGTERYYLLLQLLYLVSWGLRG